MVAGLLGGLALVLAPGSSTHPQSAIALAAIGALAGSAGAAGIGAGLVLAEAAARSRRRLALTLSGAIAGALTAINVRAVVAVTMSALFGLRLPPAGSLLEGLCLGAAVGARGVLGFEVFERQRPAVPAGRRFGEVLEQRDQVMLGRLARFHLMRAHGALDELAKEVCQRAANQAKMGHTPSTFHRGARSGRDMRCQPRWSPVSPSPSSGTLRFQSRLHWWRSACCGRRSGITPCRRDLRTNSACRWWSYGRGSPCTRSDGTRWKRMPMPRSSRSAS